MTDIEYLKKYLKEESLENAVKRLENGEPVQYIIGNVNFYGNMFIVNKDVLIPRFETEELVSETIDYIKQYFKTPISIVDLGTGSGCIAITLKLKLPSSRVTAVDISEKALKVAKENAVKLNADIKFYNGDMLKPLEDKYDVIISNPPYISYEEEIMDIVKNNEPNTALYAPNNGLYFYEEILKYANNYLNEKNIIAFEIGMEQGNIITRLAMNYFPNAKVIIKKDMQRRDRFVFIFNNISYK